MKRFIVFDGNSILNRAYYGIRPLTTKSGLFTHATYGFFNIINKHLSSGVKYDFAAVAFDLPEPTFRHKAYDNYKATRKGMPEELAVQLPYAKRLLPAMGIKIIECPGFEADDVLGTIAAFCDADGYACDIVTGDRDSLQLITDTTNVFLAKTNETEIYNKAAIIEKYGVEPKDLIDVKALMGDSSDNIPGVAGIGEKSAYKLIAEYKSLENLYANIDNIKGSQATKLADGKEMAFLCRELAKICKDAPIERDLDYYILKPTDKKALLELFTELEFSKLIERFELNIDDNKQEDTTTTDNEIIIEINAEKLLQLVFTDAAVAFVKDVF